MPVLFAGDLAEAYGPAASSVHEGLGNLIRSVGRNRRQWDLARDTLDRLQVRLDQEVEEFVAETDPGSGAGSYEAGRRATLFMRHVLERFEETVQGLLQKRPRRIVAVGTPVVIYP